jgi:hypothetical protein
MKHLPLILLPALLVLAFAPRTATAITGGEVDDDNRYSNVGSLVVVGDAFPGVPFVTASGTLIHPRVLLTAGHVTADAEFRIATGQATTDDVRVSFGKDAFDEDSWVEVEAFVTHPLYRADAANHAAGGAPLMDIGVIILKEPVDLPIAHVAPVGLLDDLKQSGLLKDAELLAAGYGAQLTFPGPEPIPPDGLRRYSTSPVRGLLPEYVLMNQNPAAGHGGTGPVDSGGPRFLLAPDGDDEGDEPDLTLVGVNSRGTPTLVGNDLAVRADTAEVHDFIEAVIEEVELNQTP